MSMKVMNNMAATLSIGEVNRNINRRNEALRKLASGVKLNSAGDDASGFAISAKMQVRLRALYQDVQNVQNGRSMLRVAAGGIENIVSELRSLKELAINAANDHNSDADRQILQQEFDERVFTIDDIANTTNYNGKVLLRGGYGRSTPSSSMPPLNYSTVWKNVSQPTVSGTFTVDVDPDTGATSATIDSDGVYTIPSDFSGTINIKAKNVQLSGTGLTNVNIIGPSGGGANLWIDGLDITNSDDDNIINFQGDNNVLSIRGDNSLKGSASGSTAIINVGGGLVVQGDGTSTLTISGHQQGAGIGSDQGGTCGDIGICDANITFDNTSFGGGAGASIGSGIGGTVGNIQIENSVIASNAGTVDANGYGNGAYHAAIGSGSGGASCGDILIVDSDISTICTDTGIGSGFPNCTCGNIEIANSNLELHGNLSACIGAGDASSCGNISIYPGTNITSFSTKGAGIGSGQNGSTAQDVVIGSDVTIQHTSEDGAVIGTGYNGYINMIRIDGDTLANIDPSTAYTDDTQLFFPYSGIGNGRDGHAAIAGEIATPISGHPLVIHHGTKSGQALYCYIGDMQSDALKGEIPTAEDGYDLAQNPQLKAILNEAGSMSLADAIVTTQHDATVAIRVIDGALDYAIGEATTVGSYISRLEYTESNLVTASENTQASESTIRDADIAKEMLEHTKHNILAQASQSMLAQANQAMSSVLSLLE
ncbi:MAG: hypothetical protein IJ849_06755 [Selenomonadaceae bacterium]|nr:hypothetical protein [Selenomonadaceae bacterium]